MENNKKELNLGEMTPRERLDAYGIKWSKEKDTMSQEEKRNLFIMITNEAFQLFAPNRFDEKSFARFRICEGRKYNIKK